MKRKLITISVFILLLALSVVAALAWARYRSKSAPAPAPAPDNSGAPDVAPTDNTPPPAPSNSNDPNIGLEAYAGEAITVYDMNKAAVRNAGSGDDLGKITGVQDDYFVIDDKYLVKKISVIAH